MLLREIKQKIMMQHLLKSQKLFPPALPNNVLLNNYQQAEKPLPSTKNKKKYFSQPFFITKISKFKTLTNNPPIRKDN